MALVSSVLSGMKGYGIGDAIGDVVNVASGIGDYNSAREQGDSRTMAATKAVASFAWGEIYYGGMTSALTAGFSKLPFVSPGLAGGLAMVGTVAISAAQAGVGLAGSYWQNTAQKMSTGYGSRGKLGSGHFDMTEAGYTMRQRSLNAIRSNGLNTQSVLGNEARTFIRSYG